MKTDLKNRRFDSLAAWTDSLFKEKNRKKEGVRNSLLTLISRTSIPLYIYSSRKSYAFTMAKRRSSRFHILGYSLAFTMAEILISLTIIGIIAAITLPSLQANINEKTWATQRKALYSRMSQAIGMMPSLNGYGVVFEDGSINETATVNKAAQAFITDGLSKVLKINNICDGSTVESLEKCGFPKKFTKMGTNSKLDTPTTINELNGYFVVSDDNVSYSQLNTQTAAFETANGESILTFYNPNCSYTYGINLKNNQQNLMQPTICANFIFDLNGRKGPNKVGKDIGFMTAFYPTDAQIVAPYPFKRLAINDVTDFNIGKANTLCRNTYGDDVRLANIDELKSLFTNNKLGYSSSSQTVLGADGFVTISSYMSSTLHSVDSVLTINRDNRAGAIIPIPYSSITTARFICVKR